MTRIRMLCVVMFWSAEALNQFYCVCAVTAIVVRGLLCYSQILTSNCRLMVVSAFLGDLPRTGCPTLSLQLDTSFATLMMNILDIIGKCYAHYS